jgi:hypothetical protein
MTSFTVDSGARGGTLYLAKKQGGRYMVLHKTAVQQGTDYEVLLDSSLLKGKEQYALIPAGGKPIPLEPGGSTAITLE